MKTLLRTLAGSVLCLVVISAPHHAQAAADEDISQEAAVAALWEWVGLIEELRTHIDRSRLNINTLIDSSDYEANHLIRFVAEDIAYEPYPGLMRGIRGTLETQAGNAVDQAMLLAALLKDSGYDARLARTRIDDAQARLLISQLVRRPPSSEPLKESAGDTLFRMAKFLKSYESFGNASGDPEGLDMQMWQSRVAALDTVLLKTLEANGVTLSSSPVPIEIVEEARDYLWVQYRLGPSDPWEDAHPVFIETPESFRILESSSTFADTIPVDLQQRFRLQLLGTRRVGDRTEEVVLTETWERPVANLFQVPVVLRVQPVPFELAEDGEQPPRLFIPMLGDGIAPGGKAFDLDGNIVPVDAAMNFMAGVFRTVGAKTNAAATALGQLGVSRENAPDKAMTLEDLWLEIALILPGDENPQTWRRSFRSVHGDHALTDASVARRIVLNVNFGPLSPAAFLDGQLGFHAESLKLSLEQHAQAKNASSPPVPNQAPPASVVDRSYFDRPIVFDGFLDLHQTDNRSIISYRSAPMIVANHASLGMGFDEPEGLDIVNNTRRSFETSNEGPPRYDPAATYKAGLWEAIGEAALLDLNEATPVSAVHASTSMLSGAEPKVFTLPPATIAGPPTRQSLSNRIPDALAQGRVVIMPPPPSSNTEVNAWWEIDPKTGQTIGVTKNGWGGAFFLIGASTVERLPFQQFASRFACILAADMSCTSYAKISVVALQQAVIGGGRPAIVLCELAMLAIPGIIESPCTLLVSSSSAAAGALLRQLERQVFRSCFRKGAAKCAAP